VSNVEAGSAAAKGGLQAGDVVIGFNGKPIENSGELPAIVADTKPGETVNVRVVRNGAEQDVKVTVAEMPSQRTQVAGAPAMQQGKLGVSVRQTDKGIVVESAEGPAEKAGVRAGDIIVGVNGKPVKSPEELKAAIDATGKQAALLVQRGDTRLFLPVQIG
jgi:serine protease Do